MKEIIQFLIAHWYLSLLFVLILVMIIIEERKARVREGSGVSPQRLTQMVNREKVVIIDIRDKEAFQSGHILNSKNIPFDEIDAKQEKINKYKNDNIVVICEAGVRSGQAAKKLRKDGAEKAVSLGGGIAAWKKAGLPVTQK